MDCCISDAISDAINVDNKVAIQLNRYLDKGLREKFHKMEDFETEIAKVFAIF
jgi:hypothetical protein